MLASDSAGRPIGHSAKGLPSGLRIDPATGRITGSARGATPPAGKAVDTLTLELYDQRSGDYLATVHTWKTSTPPRATGSRTST